MFSKHLHQSILTVLRRLQKPPPPPEEVKAAENRVWTSLVAQQPRLLSMSTSTPSSSRFILSPVLMFALVIVLASAGTLGYLSLQHSASPETSTTQTTVATIPTTLFNQPQLSKNASVGYLKIAAHAQAKPNTVFAAGNSTYQPVLFYSKDINGMPQIFSYNLTTSKEEQLTTDLSTRSIRPIFSTASQYIAYYNTSSKDDYPCSVAMRPVSSGVASKVFSGADLCYSPTSWTKDGQELLLSKGKNGGPLTDLVLYSISKGTEQLLPMPSSKAYNLSAVTWFDNDTLLVMVSEQPTSSIGGPDVSMKLLNVRTGKYIDTALKNGPTPSSYQVYGNQLYFFNGEGLYVQPLDLSSPPKQIGSWGTYDNFVAARLDKKGNVISLILDHANGFDKASDAVFEINPITGEKIKDLSIPVGSEIVGWSDSYDNLVYRYSNYSGFSGGDPFSSLFVYNFQIGKATKLVGGLTVMQDSIQ